MWKLDESHSAEHEEDGTDPICSQQWGQKQKKWKIKQKQQRNCKEWNSPPVITPVKHTKHYV